LIQNANFFFARKITDIHEPGKRLERRSTFQEKYYKTLDPDPGAEERLAEFKKLISQSIDDTLMDIIKTLPGESQAEGGGSFHVLKQIDKMIAQELWKLDTPPLRRIKGAFLPCTLNICIRVG
jgi:hypothetical protein